MERIILVNCVVILTFALLVDTVLSQQSSYDAPANTVHAKEAQPYFWFGPRLGRRKRNPLEDNLFKTQAVLEKAKLESLLNGLQESPWALVTLTDGRRHTANYTPRLGRESNEDFGNDINMGNDRWLQDMDTEYVFQRSPPFAPRLGRRMSPFSPRLGRENDKI